MTKAASKKSSGSKNQRTHKPTEGETKGIVETVSMPSQPDQVLAHDTSGSQAANDGLIRITQEKFLAIVEEVGLTVEEKKAWLKVAGPSGARIYLPKRKVIGRVDIADFEAPPGTSVKLGSKSFGAVKEQLDLTVPEEQALENFRIVLRHLASLPPAEPKAKNEADEAPAIPVLE